MSLPQLSFRPGKEKRLALGYLWAFRNELNFKERDYAPGSLVSLQTSKGRPLGVGFLNSQSNLCFRYLGSHREIQDEATAEALIHARLRSAIQARPAWEARRLVFSEGDFLSGLVVDQFREVLVMQIGSLGLEKRKSVIVEALKEITHCKAIVERSESEAREKEGLERISGLLWSEGSLSDAILRAYHFSEAGLDFEIDLLEGQKTGFYLDQRLARQALQEYSKGKRCLDVFCNVGALSLSMAKGGATSVHGVDDSEPAVEAARGNAARNQLKATFEKGNAFSWLREHAESEPESYDLIALDPPSMAHNRAALGDALRGYKELNLRALRLLKSGGHLLSCSCTQALSEEAFEGVLQSAASDAGVRIQELQRFGQAADHPRHPAMPETRYLKSLLFRKL